MDAALYIGGEWRDSCAAKPVFNSATGETIGTVTGADTPWNFPALTPMRKIAGALSTGCSLILKPFEETPLTAFEIVRAFHDVIRKIIFTGSPPIGMHLLGLAVQGAKPETMELGGLAPVIVCDDVEASPAAALSVKAKFRNAGQVCTVPTRFFVQEGLGGIEGPDAYLVTKSVTMGLAGEDLQR